MSNHPLSSASVTFFNGLRFVLASTVVIGHGFGFFFGYWDGLFPNKFPYIQSIAVVGFFCVSGFLISMSVFEKLKGGDSSFRSYMVDRFSRIYCALLPCILFVAVVDYAAYKMYPRFEFSGNLNFPTFIEKILLIPSMPFGSMRPIWSLMFEWWIYILFGALVFVNKNRVLGIIALVLGVYYTFFVNGNGEAGQLGTIWAVGAIAALYFKDITNARFNKLLASTLLLITAAVLYAVTLDAYDLCVGSLFSAGLILLAAHKNTLHVRSAKKSIVYQFLAGYSFTLFLTHYTVLSWVWRAGIHGVSGFLLSIFAANLIAIFIARYTEVHHKSISNCINRMLSSRCESLACPAISKADFDGKKVKH